MTLATNYWKVLAQNWKTKIKSACNWPDILVLIDWKNNRMLIMTINHHVTALNHTFNICLRDNVYRTVLLILGNWTFVNGFVFYLLFQGQRWHSRGRGRILLHRNGDGWDQSPANPLAPRHGPSPARRPRLPAPNRRLLPSDLLHRSHSDPAVAPQAPQTVATSAQPQDAGVAAPSAWREQEVSQGVRHGPQGTVVHPVQVEEGVHTFRGLSELSEMMMGTCSVFCLDLTKYKVLLKKKTNKKLCSLLLRCYDVFLQKIKAINYCMYLSWICMERCDD